MCRLCHIAGVGVPSAIGERSILNIRIGFVRMEAKAARGIPIEKTSDIPVFQE